MKEVQLSKGSHPSRQDTDGNWTVCAMELGAYLAGLEHTDRPACVSPVLLSLMIGLNDHMDDETRQRLRPYIVRALGTAGDGQDERRGYMVADWVVRECVPIALDARGLKERAQTLRNLPAVKDEETARAAYAAAVAGAATVAGAAAYAADAAAAAADADADAAYVWESALSMLDRVIDPGGIHDVKTEAEWLEGAMA